MSRSEVGDSVLACLRMVTLSCGCLKPKGTSSSLPERSLEGAGDCFPPHSPQRAWAIFQ